MGVGRCGAARRLLEYNRCVLRLRRPLDLVFALGSLAWPVGYLAFGAGDRTGDWLIVAGAVMVLAAMAAEVLLRERDKRRARADATPGRK